LIRDDEDFSKGLKLVSESKVERVQDRYEILTAKRRLNVYQANRKVFHLATATGKKMDVISKPRTMGWHFAISSGKPEESTQS